LRNGRAGVEANKIKSLSGNFPLKPNDKSEQADNPDWLSQFVVWKVKLCLSVEVDKGLVDLKMVICDEACEL
jgi:hypothetical protein